MDRGAWWAIVHGIAKSQMFLSLFQVRCRRHLYTNSGHAVFAHVLSDVKMVGLFVFNNPGVVIHFLKAWPVI